MFSSTIKGGEIVMIIMCRLINLGDSARNRSDQPDQMSEIRTLKGPSMDHV